MGKAKLDSVADEVVRYAGGDDGHYGVKLVTDEWVETYIPSRVADGAQIIALADDREDNFWETEDGKSFTVSESLPGIDTRFKEYALSDVNRVLVHHALCRAGYGGQQVKIVTGLPVSDYFFGSQVNADFIARKEKNLLDKTVSNKNPSVKAAKIIAHSVVSEGLAAFYDLLIDRNGKPVPEIQALISAGPIAFADIGGKTTDVVVIIDGGRGVDPKRSGTADLGGLSLNVALENRLKSALKVSSLTPSQVERAAMTGTIRLFGEDRDVSEHVNAEKTVLAASVIDEVKRRIGDGSDLEGVFFVGGGSLLLKDQLMGLYPHARMVESPQFANARGMLKIAKFIKG